MVYSMKNRKTIFNAPVVIRLSEEQKQKGHYVMLKKNKKLAVFLRDQLQEEIEKYEKENWRISTVITDQTYIK